MDLAESPSPRAERPRLLAPLCRGLAVAAGVAVLALAPAGVWADQSNANSSTTDAAQAGGLLRSDVVAPVTAAVGVNLACPANVNVAAAQRDSGNCAPGAQSNSNTSTTRAGGDGILVAPVTAATGP